MDQPHLELLVVWVQNCRRCPIIFFQYFCFIFQIVDRDSYILVWELLILLMRQKNAIDGSDIAELLLKDRRDIHLPYASKKVSPVEEVTFHSPKLNINAKDTFCMF